MKHFETISKEPPARAPVYSIEYISHMNATLIFGRLAAALCGIIHRSLHGQQLVSRYIIGLSQEPGLKELQPGIRLKDASGPT